MSGSPASEIIVIEPNASWSRSRWAELWRYRELFLALTKKEVSVRYKQAVVGILWVLGRPLFMLLILSFVFGRLAKISTGDLPYPAFVLPGLLLWLAFAGAVNHGSASLVANIALLTKVYFPRSMIPLAAIGAELVDLLVMLPLLVIVLFIYDVVPGYQIVLAPLFVLLVVIFATGLTLALSGLNALYRDIGIALPFLVQVWMYATPVVYPLSIVPPPYDWILVLNPMTGLIEGFRWSLTGANFPGTGAVIYSALAALVVLVTGLRLFIRLERTFVDRI